MAATAGPVAQPRNLDRRWGLHLLVFTQDGVPTWEVRCRAKSGSSRDDLIAGGIAETFEAAKAAALFEARARSRE